MGRLEAGGDVVDAGKITRLHCERNLGLPVCSIAVRLRLPLFGAFLVVPIVEIMLFVAIGQRIGLAATLIVVVFTAVLGSTLVARQGRATWIRLQTELAQGEVPGQTVAHGAMILVAGALLLTPGFLTDAVGFALLVPAVREWLRFKVVNRYRNRWTIVR